MQDIKLRGICKGCKQQRWFVRKRMVKLPIGQTAKSHDLICSTCFNKLSTVLKSNEIAHE